MEENKAEIVEKKLSRMQWIEAKLGYRGHPFRA
jgi:hypothetical protein